MAGAYATVAARGKHCDARPVTQILNSRRQGVQELPEAVPAGDAAVHRRHDQRHPQGRDGSPAVSARPSTLDKQSAGKTGTIQDNMAVWFDGYTPGAGDRRDDRRRQLAGAADHAERPDASAARYIDVAHGSTVAGPMWAQAMRAVQDKLPAETSRRRSGTDRGPDPGRDPRRDRHVDPPCGRAAGRCGLLRQHRRPTCLRRARGHRGRDEPGAGESAPAARRSTSTRRPATESSWQAHPAELAAYGGRHRATVRTTLGLRREHAHHPAHRPHAVVADAELVDRRGDERLDLVLGRAARAGSRRSPRPPPAPWRPARRGRRRRRPRPPHDASWTRW